MQPSRDYNSGEMEIPGYQIKRTIGRGGMGTAYLAVQESLGREVVLKTLNASYTEDSAYFERFLNEGVSSRP